jgi:hypothetical protein
MNTIPTTFNAALPSYTAVGGNERKASTGLSAVVLNRGGRGDRFGLFEELLKAGFDYVVSVEGEQRRFDVEELSGAFPFARFLLLRESVGAGGEINLAASELSSPLFFVLWNDTRILRGGSAARMAERLLLTAEELSRNPDDKNTSRRLCTVPVIQDGRFEIMPTLTAPVILKGNIGTVPFLPRADGLPTLYPFEGMGIYDRERFIRLGGFDATLKSFHWQLMDFGLRARLWGEEIAASSALKLSRDSTVPAGDSTRDESYRRFYLKNIAPVFRGDYANIPLRRFPGFFRRSGVDFFSAKEEFAAARRWVAANSYRFRGDIRTITDVWKDIHEAEEAGS